MSIKPFKGQDYEQLKSRYNEDHLFEDSSFPANDRSMYHTQMPPQGVRWLRPKEARKDPKFVVDGFNRCDMDQGHLGNCWFIAGCVGIMQNQKLFEKVVPLNQSFDSDYNGMFHFRFWLYGEWVDVVIDDRLPYWPDGRLVFCSNKQQPDEYWGPLLEKAYAKLYGSYENLEAGQTFDALIDMSGGVEEEIDLDKLEPREKANFWNILLNGFKKGSIMGCSINADNSVKEARLSNGLVRGHAYTITNIAEIRNTKLLRIRNPWGNEVEWNGPWSDNSSEWNSISESERREIGLVKDKDGEFWMSLNDFMTQWDSVQICHLTIDSYSDELLETDNDADLLWKCQSYHSAWVRGSTAGGCGQGNQAKFWTNPQFMVKLSDVDKDDNENKATIIVSVMQKDSRLKRIEARSENPQEEFIQFRLFKIKDNVQVDENQTTGLRLYSNQLDRIGMSGSYINSRQVTKRFRVDPGNYLIIPSTYDEDRDCEFMVRIFTEQLIDAKPLDEHKDNLDDDEIHYDEKPEDHEIKNWISFIKPIILKNNIKIGNFNLHDLENLRNNINQANFGFQIPDFETLGNNIGNQLFGGGGANIKNHFSNFFK